MYPEKIFVDGWTKMKISDSSRIKDLPIKNIGVVFCTPRESGNGREFEKLADLEVVDVAHAVQAALCKKGYYADLINLEPKRFNNLCKYDWIFNLTETIYGFPFTEHEVAAHMESMHIHFTGSASYVLKACLNKAVTKAKLMKYGVLTPAYDVFHPDNFFETKCRYPVIVKPVHEDGSIGISSDSIAWNDAQLKLRVEHINQVYHQAALVEEFIEGRDISAAILGNGRDAVVLPLSEIIYTSRSASKFLTFEAKWLSESVDYQSTAVSCPCVLDPQIESAVKQTALRAYQIMGCRDYARVDFRLKNNRPYVLEVNPNPCINPQDSGFVRCGMAAGFEYADLIHQILLTSVDNSYRVLTNWI